MKRSFPTGRQIESFPIPLPDGRRLVGREFVGAGHRSSRRIIVWEEGRVVFDTDDCFDRDNAISRLALWLADERDLIPVAEAATDPAEWEGMIEETLMRR